MGSARRRRSKSNLKEYNCNGIRCYNDPKAKLGKGGNAVVLCCVHSSLGNIAVKCFHVPGGEADQEYFADIVRVELELLQKANHENITRVFGWSKWSNSMGLIMEYQPGGNLKRLLMNKRIDLHPKLRLRVSSEIAKAISFLHNFSETNRLIHNDLKPDNILLSEDLHCKIADFGAAKLVEYTTSSVSQTEPPVNQMTLVYAAPERLSGKSSPSKEHDTYSFGVIIHSILSREKPDLAFSSRKMYLDEIMKGERPATTAIDELKEKHSADPHNFAVIERLASVMCRCWEQNPRCRPKMFDIANELGELLNDQSHKEIENWVAAALTNMRIYLPSEGQHRCIPLSCFDTLTEKFTEGTTEIAA